MWGLSQVVSIISEGLGCRCNAGTSHERLGSPAGEQQFHGVQFPVGSMIDGDLWQSEPIYNPQVYNRYIICIQVIAKVQWIVVVLGHLCVCTVLMYDYIMFGEPCNEA